MSVYALCLSEKTLQIINVINPEIPEVKGSLTLDRNLLVIRTDGKYAYIGSDGKIFTVDLSDIDAPVLVDTKTNADGGDLSGGAGILGMTIHNGYLFAATSWEDQCTINAYSLANSAEPTFVNSVKGSGSIDWTLYRVRSLSGYGDYLYAIGEGYNEYRPNLCVLEISNVEGGMTVDYDTKSTQNYVGDIYNAVLYSMSGGHLKSSDIVSAPPAVSTLDTYIDNLGNIHKLYRTGNYLYNSHNTSSPNGGIEVTNISDPSDLIHVGAIHDTDGGADLDNVFWEFDGYGDYIFILFGTSDGSNDGLEIISIVDRASPVHVTTVYNGDDGAILAGTTHGGVAIYSIGTNNDLNLPIFRHEDIALEFGKEIYAPSFPVQSGIDLHTYPTGKPAYTITTRNHGTVETSWKTEDVKQNYRNSIYGFWSATLTKGYKDFTVVDHRKRMLFDTSWNNWRENWSKLHGGIYSIEYGLQSPVTWTPPVHGAYLMADNTLNNHIMDSNDLAVDDGVLTSTGILRSNGSALKLTGNGSSTGLVGATGVVSWESENAKNNLTVFCQFRLPQIKSGAISVIEIDALGNNRFCIKLEADTVTDNLIYGSVQNAGSATEIKKGPSEYHLCTVDTWYDVALTYDGVADQTYLYIIESDTTTHTQFLSGAATQDEQIGETNFKIVSPPDVTWTTCNLLREANAVGLHSGTTAYLQNAFIFNGFLSAAEFDMMRELCLMWNNKTETFPK